MAFYKIYKSGENYEVYEYERNPIIETEFGTGYNLENATERVSDDVEDYAKEDRTDERRAQTLRENAMALKRMAREYFRDRAYFITLTYSDRWACDSTQIDKSDRRTKSLWKKLREFGEISYVGVRELQKKRNVIHYHYIVSSAYLDTLYDAYEAEIKNNKKNQAHKDFENMFEGMFWKYGFVDIRPIDEIDDTGAYLAKYMSKAKLKEMEWLEKRRLILRSDNIKKIEPLCSDNDSEEIKNIIAEMNLYKSIAEEDIQNKQKRKRVFTNGYYSDFNGLVMYYEIHKNRL